MPRGISLHVGINEYSSAFPGAATLNGCLKDAEAMAHVAEISGFKQRDVLLDSDATYMRVTTKIRSAAAQLEQGDIFFFSFAGHGFQLVDQGNDGDEQDDFLDETLLLFDAELSDDVLRKELWPCFKPGVRVLMIADCCHSGTAHTAPPENVEVLPMNDPPVSTGTGPVRTIDIATSLLHHDEYGEFYRSTLVPLCSPTVTASILLLAACEDHEKTGDGKKNGVYTAAMLEVLKSNPVDYVALVNGIQKIFDEADRDQHPKISTLGPDFSGQKPFTI